MLLWWHLRRLQRTKYAFSYHSGSLRELNAQEVARQAIRALGRYRGNARAVEALCSLLTDSSRELRGFAAQALHQMAWMPESPDERIRLHIAARNWDALIELGDTGMKALADLLNREHGWDDQIVHALRRTHNVAAVETLRIVLRSNADGTRTQAAAALAAIGSAKAFEALLEAGGNPQVRSILIASASDSEKVDHIIAALSHERLDVRASAADILGELRVERAAAALMAAYKQAPATATAPVIAGQVDPRPDIAHALSAMGQAAVGPCLEALDDGDAQVRALGAGILGALQYQPAVVPLLAALERDHRQLAQGVLFGAHQSMRSVIEALGRCGDARAVAAIEQCLKDGDLESHFEMAGSLSLGLCADQYERGTAWREFIRVATEALSQFKGAAVPVIAQLLLSSDARLRDHAVAALGRMGKVAVPTLIKHLSVERDDSVVELCVRSLQKLTKKKFGRPHEWLSWYEAEGAS